MAAARRAMAPFREEAAHAPPAAHLNEDERRWALEGETIFLTIAAALGATLNDERVRALRFPLNVFFQAGQALGVVLQQYPERATALLLASIMDGIEDGMQSAEESHTLKGTA